MAFVCAIAGLIAVLLLELQAFKYSDSQQAKNTWQSLADFEESSPQFFSP